MRDRRLSERKSKAKASQHGASNTRGQGGGNLAPHLAPPHLRATGRFTATVIAPRNANEIRLVGLVFAIVGLAGGLGWLTGGGGRSFVIHYWNEPVTVPFVAVGGLMCAVAATILAAIFFGGSATLALDDGGLRWSWRRQRGYFAFADLRDARLEGGALGRKIIVLETINGQVTRLPVDREAQTTELLSAILRRAGRDGRDPNESVASTSFLDRQDLSLETWLSTIRSHVVPTEGGAYRSAAVDEDSLQRIAADRSAAAERRAGAVHGLLASNDAARLASVRTLIDDEDAPPIVVVAAEIASPGIASSRTVRAALAHLPETDRAEARTALGHVRISEPRIRIAERTSLRELDATAISDLEDEPAAPAHRRARSLRP